MDVIQVTMAQANSASRVYQTMCGSPPRSALRLKWARGSLSRPANLIRAPSPWAAPCIASVSVFLERGGGCQVRWR